ELSLDTNARWMVLASLNMKLIFKIVRPQERWKVGVAAAAATALVLRLWALPRALDATDAVNFALALDRFDVLKHQPHFPGYPLYVLLCHVAALFVDAPAALGLPGALASAALVAAVARAVRGRAGDAAGLAAAWLVAAAPPLVAV